MIYFWLFVLIITCICLIIAMFDITDKMEILLETINLIDKRMNDIDKRYKYLESRIEPVFLFKNDVEKDSV